MFQLSVCAGTVLQNLPFLERVREIARAGFLIDLWGWDDTALDEIAADPNITIGAMPGWGQSPKRYSGPTDHRRQPIPEGIRTEAGEVLRMP